MDRLEMNCNQRTSHVATLSALCMLSMFAVSGCSKDLPKMQPVPEDETGMQADNEKGSSQDASKGSMGDETAAAGRSSATGGTGATTSGRTGGAPAAGGSSGSMSTGSSGSSGGAAGAGNGMAAASGSRASGGAAGAMPAGQMIAACMGRNGETVCDGAMLIKCGDGGAAGHMERCMTAAQCRAGLPSGACGACDPGAVQCMGAELRECSMSGEFVMKEACASDKLCNEAAKKCDPPACEADEHKCDSGALLKCKEDRSDFEFAVPSCPPELCDAAAKKCNMCVPSSKECQGTTLRTCAADGSGFTDMKCAEPTDQCVEGRCVECTSNSECMPSNNCQDASCNMQTGRCNAATPKPAGTACTENGGKVCSLVGSCVACNTDLDCNASQRCSAVFGCIARQALQAGISLLPGTHTVTLNAGYALKSRDPSSNLGLVSYSAGLFAGGGQVPRSGSGNLLEASPDQARTITFTGDSGATCPAIPQSDTEVMLQFATPVDMSSTATCDQSVTIYAVKGG
jgi:hypothetical protein